MSELSKDHDFHANDESDDMQILTPYMDGYFRLVSSEPSIADVIFISHQPAGMNATLKDSSSQTAKKIFCRMP